MGEEEKVLEMIYKIFEKKKRKFGIKEVKLDLELNTIGSPPIVGENVYGEAFPFENPPRIWLEIFVLDAMMKKIVKILCHELAHIKHPELPEEELSKRPIMDIINGKE